MIPIAKKGTHSVGMTRQYCGQVGKQENCHVAVSLSVAMAHASLPGVWRLDLPQAWAEDQPRRRKAGVPLGHPVYHQTGPRAAADPRRAGARPSACPGAGRCRLRHPHRVSGSTHPLGAGATPGPRVANDGLASRRNSAAAALDRGGRHLRRTAQHAPVSVKELALRLPTRVWKFTWRPGTRQPLRSRFAASARPVGASRLRSGTAPGRRMAPDRNDPAPNPETHPVLALRPARRQQAGGAGPSSQTPLDHRA
jgi:hypothetical protein